ncbi:hypothetical protein Tco_1173698 [Tanacetum coccineum]
MVMVLYKRQKMKMVLKLKFHGIKDAQSKWAVIKSRFGGNVESKKILLEVHCATVPNEDANQNFLRALPSSWNNVALIIGNKDEDTSSSNDVNTANSVSTASGHNSQGQASSSSYTDDLIRGHFARECRAPRNQGNMNGDAGYKSRDNTRRTVPVETYDALVLGLESVEVQLVVHQKNEAVYEEKIAVLEFEVKDKSNAITRLKNQLDETLREKDNLKAKLEQFETSSKNLNKLINSQISSKDKTGLGYGDQLNENDSSGSELFNSVFDSRSSDGDDNQTNDRFKKDNGYHVVPPPLTGNYMPPLADLSFAGLDDSVYRPTTNKTSASVSQVETSITPPSNTSVEMPRVESVRPSGVIIEDWVSDDDEDIFQSNDLQATDKPSFKRIEFTNARNESVKPKQAEKPRIITQNPKVDRRDWNGKMTQKLRLGFGSTKKAYFVCGSYNLLIKDCDFHEKIMAKKSVLKNMGKNTILTRSGKVPVSTAKKSSLRATSSTSTFRPVNIATHTNRVNVSKLRTNVIHKSHSPIRRSFYKSTEQNTRISNEKVNTVRVNGINTAGQTAVSAVKGNGVTAIKASTGNPQQALKNKGIFDSGCSRHMTGNKDFLTDYQDIDGGFVAFGGKSSVRSDLLFNDEDCVTCLTNDEIFENLALMGYEQLSTKLTFQKGNITPLFASMLVQNQAPEGEAPQTEAHQTAVSLIVFHEAYIEQILLSPTTYHRKRKTKKHRRAKKDTELPQTSVPLDHGADEVVHKEGGDNVERAITTVASLDAAQDSDNILRTQTMAMPNFDIPQGMDTGGTPRRQETMGGTPAQTRSERVLEQPNEPPLSEGHTSRSEEGSMEQTFELTNSVPSTPHDSPLTGGYTPGSDKEILNLKKRVKKLERKRKSSISHPRRRKYRQVETSSDDDLDEEDASKQGRRSGKLKPMFKDKDFEELDDHMENVEEETVDAAATGVSTVSAPVSTAGITISTSEPKTPPTTTTIFDD